MIDDLSAGSVVTLEISTPSGIILAMGEASLDGRRIIADGVHMHGVGAGRDAFGPAALRVIAEALWKG